MKIFAKNAKTIATQIAVILKKRNPNDPHQGSNMIFPDVLLEDWLKKYPNLETVKRKCEACNKEMIANRPYVERGYAGVIAEACPCGEGKHICSSRVTTSKETFEKWSNILKGFI